MLDTLINKYLPDFTKKKISKEEAAEQLYQALCKQARSVGHDPAWEVSKPTPYPNTHTHTDEERSDIQTDAEYKDYEQIMVSYEAGPYDWGVGYSLSSHPESYDMMNNPQDWYLETHWGFDVVFTDK